MKRVNTLFLTIIILCSLLPINAFGSEENMSQDDEVTESLPSSATDIETLDSTTNSETTVENSDQEPIEEQTTETSSVEQQAETYAGELGTVDNPVLAGNAAELSSAIDRINNTISNPFYIKLTNDITYYSAPGKNINGNVVIDGDDHTVVYGTDYTYDYFRVNQSNLNVTIKNMNFRQNSSYYGFIRVNNSNNTLNIENVTYDVTRGGQPFYSYYGNNILNFSGTNTFKVDNYSDGSCQEFSEGFSTVNFKQNSITSIYQMTDAEQGVFWFKSGSGSANLTVEENARVDISSGKESLFYTDANLTMNVRKNGVFNFNRVSSREIYNELTRIKTTLNLYTEEDSKVNFSTEDRSLNAKTLNVYANNADHVGFHSTGSNAAIGNGTVYVTRTDTSNSLYQINSVQNNVTTTNVDNIATNSRQTINANMYRNKSTVIYERLMSLDGLIADAAVGHQLSKINANTVGYKTMSNRNNFIRYLLSEQQLSSQDEIRTVYVETLVLKPEYTQEIPASAVPDAPVIFNNLMAGDYHLYGQAVASTNGASAQTSWVEIAVTVPEYKSLSIVNSIGFSVSDTNFSENENHDLANYIVINNGNTYQGLSLKNLTVNPNSAPDVSLVTQLSTANESQLEMNLVARKLDSGNLTTWGPLLANQGSTSSLKLSPFWQNDHSANLYVEGKYSGPLYTEKKVSYSLDFGIATVDP